MIIKQFSRVALGLALLATTAIAEEKAAESILSSHDTAAAAAAEHCEVKRLQTAKGVSNREPQEVTETFSSSAGKIFAFAELSCSRDGHVTFHWKHEGKEHAKVSLPVKHSARWRTHATSSHMEPGNWSVAVVDESGNTLKEVNFTITGSESSQAAMHHADSAQPEHPEQTTGSETPKAGQ